MIPTTKLPIWSISASARDQSFRGLSLTRDSFRSIQCRTERKCVQGPNEDSVNAKYTVPPTWRRVESYQLGVPKNAPHKHSSREHREPSTD